MVIEVIGVGVIKVEGEASVVMVEEDYVWCGVGYE